MNKIILDDIFLIIKATILFLISFSIIKFLNYYIDNNSIISTATYIHDINNYFSLDKNYSFINYYFIRIIIIAYFSIANYDLSKVHLSYILYIVSIIQMLSCCFVVYLQIYLIVKLNVISNLFKHFKYIASKIK